MSLHQYNLGKRHGRLGIRALAHRNCLPYEVAKANESYLLGYSDGVKERGSARLDYSRKENNKVFYDGRRRT